MATALIWLNSPCGNPGSIYSLVTEGPQAAFADTMHHLGNVSPAAKRPEVAAALRQAKRSAALAIAVADIGAIWPWTA